MKNIIAHMKADKSFFVFVLCVFIVIPLLLVWLEQSQEGDDYIPQLLTTGLFVILAIAAIINHIRWLFRRR